MRLLKKKSFTVIALMIVAFPLIQASGADPAGFTAKDLTPIFLRDVIGLDMTEYHITNEGYGSDYPPSYGGEVKKEVVSFELTSDQGNLRVMGTFYDGFIYTLAVYYVNGSVIYSREPSNNAVDESRTMLQRYKTFAQNLGWGTSHVDQASEMLNNVFAASSKSDLHLFNNVFGFVPTIACESNMKLETNEKRVDWIYTEKGANMTWKSLSFNFGGNKLSFADTWNLYKVGSLSGITEEEAKSIGWEAARNYNVTFTYENGTTVPVTPKWSNVSEIGFSMIPGQIHKMDPNSNVNSGSVNREPLSLYPHWQMIFYFEMIGGAAGVQVGVWGDTKEIAYINLYGYLGAPGVPGISSTEPQPENSPEDSPEGSIENSPAPTLPSSDEPDGNQDIISTEPSLEATPSEKTSQSESKSNTSTNMVLVAGVAAAAATAIAIALAVFKKRRK